jgi:hypothetical protein
VKSLRLFGTGISNPKHESEVKGMDLVSTKSQVTWVVVAVTTGPSGLLKAPGTYGTSSQQPYFRVRAIHQNHPGSHSCQFLEGVHHTLFLSFITSSLRPASVPGLPSLNSLKMKTKFVPT